MLYFGKRTSSIKRAAIIDIGSESIRLIVGERKRKELKILELVKNILPIGKDTFYKNMISQASINQTIVILSKYLRLMKDYDVKACRIIATTAVRDARNRDVFIDTIKRKTGLEIEVFTAGDIIYFIDSYIYFRLKDQYPIHKKNLLIAELGAGSVEFSLMEQGYMLMNVGLPMGTLKLDQRISTLRHTPREAYHALEEYIEYEFKYIRRAFPQVAIDDVILISENFGFLVDDMLKKEKSNATIIPLTRAESDMIKKEALERLPDELVKKYGIPMEVADTLDVLSLTVDAFFEITKNDSIFLFETSLHEAVLTHLLFNLSLQRRYKKSKQLFSVARALGRKYNVDVDHSEQVVRLGRILFNQLYRYIGLNKADLLYLLMAAYLHDIGKFISNRAHHKHSEYIITSLNLFRLTEQEIKIIAAIARYHRRSTPRPAHIVYSSLFPEHQILVQKLSALLRIADALDRSHHQKIQGIHVSIMPKEGIVLEVTSDENLAIEQAFFQEKKGMLEDITGDEVILRISHGRHRRQ
jgi:exopolyphosphatase/guanosine-5'-triphosphate,3'-diphosphate pyrophosphatase